MALDVPGFDPTLHVSVPVWEDFLDVLEIAHAHILYFRLQAKVGLYYDSRKKSCTFLRALQHTEYVDVVTLLQTSVETCQDQFDDGYLPTHLCLMGLAQRIEWNRHSHIREVLPLRPSHSGLIISAHMSIVQTLVAVVGILVILVTVLVVITVVMCRAQTVALIDPAILIGVMTQHLGAITPVLIAIVASTIRICNAKLANGLVMLPPHAISLRRHSLSPSI